MAKNSETITFEIIEKVAVLSEDGNGWSKELNFVSWNGYEPKFDIRSWADNYTRMTRGVQLTVDEMEKLKKALGDKF